MKRLFSVGIGEYKLNSNFDIDKNYLDNLEYENNFNNSISINNQFLNHPNFLHIKVFCQQCVDDYHNNLCKYTSKLKIVSSWLNKNLPNQSHHMHKHQNAILTGVFYLDNINETPITFYNPILQSTGFYEEPSEYNDYNCYSRAHTFSKNTCIVFPSYLFHSVVKNNTEFTRYTIAFNTFYENNQMIGNKTTELKL